MDHLFRPWRYAYVSAARSDEGCILCRIAAGSTDDDRDRFVLGRRDHHYVVLNAYPYNNGHLMIVPYAHVASLSDMGRDALTEMAALAARAEAALRETYRPEGVNLGMNLGVSAGAGIADHLHLHVVPRWGGDTNFMSVIGESRVLPEALQETWARLAGRF